MLKCLIIDDEVLAIALLKEYIDKLDFLGLVAAFSNPLEALSILEKEVIDVIFLDIQMPELTGTEFAKMVNPPTQIIFTTAYSQFAAESYELNALDYLLKPIEFPRFLTAVNKVKKKASQLVKDQTITIKSGYDLYIKKYSEILYVQSDVNYVLFHTTTKQIMSYQSMKSLEETLDNTIFKRVHRSYIVNKNAVTALKGRTLYLGEISVPVSDKYYDKVKNELF